MQQHAACRMQTHISSRIKIIRVRAVWLLSAPLHNNIFTNIWLSQKKEIEILREFDLNLKPHTVCAIS